MHHPDKQWPELVGTVVSVPDLRVEEQGMGLGWGSGTRTGDPRATARSLDCVLSARAQPVWPERSRMRAMSTVLEPGCYG